MHHATTQTSNTLQQKQDEKSKCIRRNARSGAKEQMLLNWIGNNQKTSNPVKADLINIAEGGSGYEPK